MLTPTEAKANGFALDTTVYPWIAYKGSRMQPREIEQCYTAREADLLASVGALTAEIENARTGKRFDYHIPKEWKLTAVESDVFLQLVKREICSKESLLASVWSDREVAGNVGAVFICFLRKKLAPFGIKIGTQWGQGWFLENRAGVKAMLRAGGKALQ
jgi:DNA-binding response OmpR family regulator